jgi:hypothetical protein
MKRDTFYYYMGNEKSGDLFFIFLVTRKKEVNTSVYFLSFPLTQKESEYLH